MFLELKSCRKDGQIGKHFPVQKKSRIPQEYVWRTYLSSMPSEWSDAVFSIDDFEYSCSADIWYIILTVISESKRIIPSSYFPFGGWSQWWSRFACQDLRNKWIAGAIERLILDKFKWYNLEQAQNRLSGRNNQLESYWLPLWSPIPLYKYKKLLDRSLRSPHFRIVMFPSWITDPVILHSQDSK